ncbi:hypothetical protein [Legionella jordanis]|uniref:Uncharacterized protein n=1 Tax=Legionella jordanis TaxID=456 RepID=A0A0W0VAN9_9GAMM|nr:hypothetical protein [Legionella jordanis]KTD17176.1 hypothetical protein Ljor_1482 [Legionella jordanis]RMX03298.1 hypothetical protein EAW55_07720 [Legionella jordanis]RMX18276.1 hypothetical protein EAS68_09255 [Legionella jordanis]VEH12626.1 Uncharacterised protein [Legionella jordanis]HAT8713300.1 hypothetical protein [Legionella jordanis]
MRASHKYYLRKFNRQNEWLNANATGTFERAPDSELNGVFAYLSYKPSKTLLISKLQDYQSFHPGINQYNVVLRRRSLGLFGNSNQPASDAPAFGGELLLLNGDIIFWNFKSGKYSLMNPSLHDDSPNLSQEIDDSGLPAERFISIDKANVFDSVYLKTYFLPNGQFRNASEECVQIICAGLGLNYLDSPCTPPLEV